MSRAREIASDPYAHAKADKLWHALQGAIAILRAMDEDERRRLLQPLVDESKRVAKQAEDEYFSYLMVDLSGVPIDCGHHPAKFIEAQRKNPKLRRLYETRRLLSELHHALDCVLRAEF